MAEALDRESWSREDWSAYHEEHLTALLERAATRVPYYRAHWRARRAEGDTASWHELANWPVLSKATLRQAPRSFVADDVRLWQLQRSSTSGTSGSPVTTWQSRRTARRWYALFEARARRWYGVDRRDAWAIMGGQVVTPASQTSPPFWVWNAALRQLYLSTLHLAPEHVPAYLTALRDHRVRHLYGYASSMYRLAQMVRESGLDAPELVVAVSNAEPLLPHQRAMIGDVFRCPVRDSYGMSEIVAAASECEHGSMHVWPDAGVIEVLEDRADVPAAAGSTGRLVCTGLLNADMPLVRYDVGDRGALSPVDAPQCTCGRTLPLVERLEGRDADNLITRDGRRVFWLNPVFYGLPVREAQIVQVSRELVRVHLVLDPGQDAPQVDATIVSRLRQRVGDLDVQIERVTEIPRGANGKFRAVVNLVDAP
ncbi:MAG: hypothetical protein P1P87_12225, partial [Trueperaceae bacterium]|nr:hypothetical protein [Trueperaceae bacterium]